MKHIGTKNVLPHLANLVGSSQSKTTLYRDASRFLHTASICRVKPGTGIVAKEDLGTIETYLPPKSYAAPALFSPGTLLKSLYHRLIVSKLHLRSFRKSIRPNDLSLRLLILHGQELRNSLSVACATANLRLIRQLCGMKLQSKIIREIKTGNARFMKRVVRTPSSADTASLVSFVQQPINTERTLNYAQAIIRLRRADGEIEDIFLVSKTWIHPITWTLESIR